MPVSYRYGKSKHCWTLIFTLRIFHTLWIIRTNTLHFVCVEFTYDQFWDLKGTSFSQMSNFRRVKNSHVFVTPVKNSFEFFTLVTNTCEFFTCAIDSFVCESLTNLSQVWKKSNVFVTPVKNSCELFTDMTNTYDSFISVKDSHEFFTSVICSHDMCDKFIKKEYLWCVHIHGRLSP